MFCLSGLIFVGNDYYEVLCVVIVGRFGVLLFMFVFVV